MHICFLISKGTTEFTKFINGFHFSIFKRQLEIILNQGISRFIKC